MPNNYLFQSQRLGFRTWNKEDISLYAQMNADLQVMEHFPRTLTLAESTASAEKQINNFLEKGYCYFATDELKSGKFIGMIGISDKDFDSEFTPCADLGWRLAKEYWGKGYATEGAKRCLQYGFETLELPRIVSIAPKVNLPSIQVMKKIGMQFLQDFRHPLLLENKKLVNCVCYEIKPNTYKLP